MAHGLYQIIGPDGGPILWWQMCIRTVIIFAYGVLLVRVAGPRAFGRHTALDIMLAVLIGSSLARALTGGAPFLPTIAAMFVLIVLFQGAIHLAQRHHTAGWLMKGRPTTLVRDGQPDHAAMRVTGVSHLDLEEAVRQACLPDLDCVGRATLERSGKISVVPRQEGRGQQAAWAEGAPANSADETAGAGPAGRRATPQPSRANSAHERR